MAAPRWPNGARAACAFTFDLDAESLWLARGVTFTFHPQIIGRPSRLACLRELVEHARHTPRLWLARLDEIAAHTRVEAT